MKPQPLALCTGLAVIVLPVIALGVKFVSAGWMMVVLLFGPIFILAAGYAFVIVIASMSFFSARHLQGANLRRAIAAAWTTSLGLLAVGLFLPDGGDGGGWGSTFQVMLGAHGDGAERVHATTDGVNAVLLYLGVAAWLGGYVWLIVEWIIGLAASRRRRREAA